MDRLISTRHPAEQACPNPPKLLMVDKLRPPPRTWATLLKIAVKRSETNAQVVVLAQRRGDIDLVTQKHVLRPKQVLVVKPYVGDRGQPVEDQARESEPVGNAASNTWVYQASRSSSGPGSVRERPAF